MESEGEIAEVGIEFEVEVTGDVESPNDVRASVIETETDEQVTRPFAATRAGRIVVPVTVWQPGLYRIAVAGAGTTPVTQLVLVVSATAEHDR